MNQNACMCLTVFMGKLIKEFQEFDHIIAGDSNVMLKIGF